MKALLLQRGTLITVVIEMLNAVRHVANSKTLIRKVSDLADIIVFLCEGSFIAARYSHHTSENFSLGLGLS